MIPLPPLLKSIGARGGCRNMRPNNVYPRMTQFPVGGCFFVRPLHHMAAYANYLEMDSVRFDGSNQDLERFARGVLKRSVIIDAPSAFERRMNWDVAGQSGFSSSTALRSGILLSATKFRWEQKSSMFINHGTSKLKFVLSRGTGPRMKPTSGNGYMLGDGQFQVNLVKQPVRTLCAFDKESGECEHLCLQIDRERLNELLGVRLLPQPVERVIANPDAHSTYSQPMVPALYRLLDEILYCDAQGSSRRLYLEAKGLELMAALVYELEHCERTVARGLSQWDIERLEHARQILLNRIESPPSLPQLARYAGLNEVKLKRGFRTLFGTSVYAYLRDQRMQEALRLLRQHNLNVSEVAVRVGYANPSKFAAAFRKQFGVTPSKFASNLFLE